MEKRTIGQFIAVLRKANGMTQKELAERLNVSDKSVSRWERDETLPDLTLIPVIAEIFGVTSDEILRGEKTVKNESEETPALKSTTKQIQHMFESTKTKFNVKCIVSISIAIMSLILAGLCNIATVRAYIAFWFASVFFVGAMMTAVICWVLSLSSVKNAEMDGELVGKLRSFIFKRGLATVLCIFVIWSTTLPLVTMVKDANFGLISRYWLMYGTLYGVIAAAICLGVYSFINTLFNIKTADSDTKAKLIKKFKIRIKYILIGFAVVVTTFLVQAYINNEDTEFIKKMSECVAFDDLEEFEVFIETPSKNNNDTDVDFRRQFIIDGNGDILLEYYHKNYDVVVIDKKWVKGELIIKTYTRQALNKGHMILIVINIGFIILYLFEIILLCKLASKRLRCIR